MGDEHLNAHEGENQGHAVFEISKKLDQSADQEIEGPQAQDGEDV